MLLTGCPQQCLAANNGAQCAKTTSLASVQASVTADTCSDPSLAVQHKLEKVMALKCAKGVHRKPKSLSSPADVMMN